MNDFLEESVTEKSSLLLQTPEQGAQTTVHVAVSEELEGISGKYFMDCKVRNGSLIYNSLKQTLNTLYFVIVFECLILVKINNSKRSMIKLLNIIKHF